MFITVDYEENALWFHRYFKLQYHKYLTLKLNWFAWSHSLPAFMFL